MKEILKHSALRNWLSRREYCILESNQDNEGFHNNIKGNQYQEKRKSSEKHPAQHMLLFGHRPKRIRIHIPLYPVKIKTNLEYSSNYNSQIRNKNNNVPSINEFGCVGSARIFSKLLQMPFLKIVTEFLGAI